MADQNALDKAVREQFGMQPNLNRLSVLPRYSRSEGWVAPEMLYQAARAFAAPGVAARGYDVSPEDAVNFAMSALGASGFVPQNAMSAGTVNMMLARRRPTKYADPTRMTTDQLQEHARQLMPRVNTAYEKGNFPLAERLDARLENTLDTMDNRFIDLAEDTVDPTVPREHYKTNVTDESEFSLEDALASMYSNLLDPAFYAIPHKNDKIAGARVVIDTPKSKANYIREELLNWAPHLGGLKKGITDQQLMRAAEDAYVRRHRLLRKNEMEK